MAAITATNQIAENGSGTAFTTVASLTAVAFDLYLATVVTRVTGGTAATPTLTGGGLTWVQIASRAQGTDASERITMFRAQSASPGTHNSLTVDCAGASQTKIVISCEQFANTDTGGTNGSAAIVQSASADWNGTTGKTGTVTLAAFANSQNATYAGWVHNVNEVTTPSSAPAYTELSDQTAGSLGCETEWIDANDTSPSATWATNAQWNGIAVEIGILPTTIPAETVALQAVKRGSFY